MNCIMLREKVVYVFRKPRESFRQSTKESVGMGKKGIAEILVSSVMSLYDESQSGF